MVKQKNVKITEDKWTYTTCGICYACCPIKVRTINGIPVRIEGNPYASTSQGFVSALRALAR